MMKQRIILAMVLLLGACSVPIQNNSNTDIQVATKEERLGTQWGDEVESRVTSVDLRRTSNEPIDNTQLLYANKNYYGRQVKSISLVAGKVSFSVDTDRVTLPIYRDAGNYYLKGKSGQPYRLTYRNNSNNTYEIVASVDGIDVINGRPASQYSAGYVLSPKGTLVIEGFRKSDNAVASFIFSKPKDAYAANTMKGKLANNTGIIGTVVYQLYDPKAHKKAQGKLQAFPADSSSTGYAKPPQ